MDKAIRHLYYQEDPALFDMIVKLRPEFSNVKTLNELPGEYLGLDPNKNYWATQIESDGFCYGIAVDELYIRVFTYGEGGSNMKLVE